jgi:glycosyltransferase involved in cell wall biosynthesis
MSDGTVRFSIIVPTLAPPAQLAGCLEAISRLDAPGGGFEVIVVDDGCPEPLDGVVDSYRNRLNLTLLRQSNRGPGAARNAGSRIARGEFLAFTDADCWPAQDWLTAMARRFEHSPQHLLGGHTVNRLTSNPYATTSQLIVDVVYAFYNGKDEEARFFASNNLAMPAARFREVGGFDERLFRNASEDRELCDRWRYRGQHMTYVPEAVVHHGHRLTFAAFCRQHFGYGRGAWNYHFVRARRGSGRLREDLRLHARFLHLLRGPLLKLPQARRWRIVPLLACWQAANAAGFCYEACRSLATPDAYDPISPLQNLRVDEHPAVEAPLVSKQTH